MVRVVELRSDEEFCGHSAYCSLPPEWQKEVRHLVFDLAFAHAGLTPLFDVEAIFLVLRGFRTLSPDRQRALTVHLQGLLLAQDGSMAAVHAQTESRTA